MKFVISEILSSFYQENAVRQRLFLLGDQPYLQDWAILAPNRRSRQTRVRCAPSLCKESQGNFFKI